MLRFPLQSLRDRYWFAAGLFIILCYTALIVLSAQNVPFADDLAVLSSINEFQQAYGIINHVKNIFAFHNEHRIAIPRILTILLFYIQGEKVNVVSWILTGNAFILGILYIFYRVGYSRVPFIYFLPVILFLVQPMHYELMYWGMASIQNAGVILLAFLSFYLLLFSDKLYVALLCATAATFTSANGIFTMVCCIGLLTYRKHYKLALLWLSLTIILLMLYWAGFSSVHSARQSMSMNFSLYTFSSTFFSFAGGLVYLQKFPVLSLLAGVFLLIFLSKLVYSDLVVSQNNDPHILFFLSCILFILVTIAAISFNRNAESISLVSRYKLYPALLTVLIYSLCLTSIRSNQYLLKFIVVFSLFFSLFSYTRFIPKFAQHNDLLLTYFFNWKQNNRLATVTSFQQRYYSANWLMSMQKEQYVIPETVHFFCKNILTKIKMIPTADLSYTEDSNRVYLTPVPLPLGTYYLVRNGEKDTMIYPMMPASPTSFFTPAVSTTFYTMVTTKDYWLSGQQTTSQIVAIP